MNIILDPHGDDVALFAAFTALREKPLVLVVFDSYVQPARGIPGTDKITRQREAQAAYAILGCEVKFIGLHDDKPPSGEALHQILRLNNYESLWGPAYEPGGHEQHNLVAAACCYTRGGLSQPLGSGYLTYTRHGAGKSTHGRKVEVEDPNWIALKLRALACYESQFHPATGCAPHFIGRSLEEYIL